MNRDTRDKFVAATQADLTSGNACWQTPPRVFDRLHQDFGPFDVDLTGDSWNALVDPWFGPGGIEPDALTAPWAAHGLRGYSNPPYGPFVGQILAKAKHEAQTRPPFMSLFLLPLRITTAFRAHVLRGASRIYLCTKRIVFFERGLPRCSYDARGRVRADCALFDSMLVEYRGYTAGVTVHEWNVPVHVTKDDLYRWVDAHPYDAWLAQRLAQRRQAAHDAARRVQMK